MAINLNGLPWGAAHFIKHVLEHETCTPDHVLLMADCIEKFTAELPPSSHYAPHCTRTISDLRDLAAIYANPPAANAVHSTGEQN